MLELINMSLPQKKPKLFGIKFFIGPFPCWDFESEYFGLMSISKDNYRTSVKRDKDMKGDFLENKKLDRSMKIYSHKTQ